MPGSFHIGTCSWKYDSWRGLVYSDAARINYLAEYASRYDCVEVDQWFWSLHGPGKVTLPSSSLVAEYAASVPEGFRFGIKLPNALTLTHFPQKSRNESLLPNPHFLSSELLHAFLERLQPLNGHLGPLMLQFGYLNKLKMPSLAEFHDRLGAFATSLPKGYDWCVETRNPGYLNADYFALLREHGIGHVFLQGYYMPPVFDIYGKHADQLTDTVVVRLHGPDREGIEERTGKDWSKIVEPRDKDLDRLADMLRDLGAKKRRTWVFANNHFEGSAPLTIQRIRERMG